MGRADVVTHREALAGLLADPRVVSGILVGPTSERPGWAYRVRGARRRIVSAGSPFHRVRNPNIFFLGFLKVDTRDREALAGAARRLAAARGGAPARLGRGARAQDGRVAAGALARGVRRSAPETPDPAEWPSLPLDADAEALVDLRRRVAEEDAVSLLLVGLVRADVNLASSRLREFSYARPASEEDVRACLRAMAEIDEDQVALDSAVKARRRLLHHVLRLARTRSTSRASAPAAAGRRTR